MKDDWCNEYSADVFKTHPKFFFTLKILVPNIFFDMKLFWKHFFDQKYFFFFIFFITLFTSSLQVYSDNPCAYSGSAQEEKHANYKFINYYLLTAAEFLRRVG